MNGRWHRLPLHEFRDTLGHRIATQAGGALHATREQVDQKEDARTDCDCGTDDCEHGKKPLELFKHGESSFGLVSFQFRDQTMDDRRTLECVRYQQSGVVMRRKIAAAMLVSLAMTAETAHGIRVPQGFFTGNNYEQLSQIEKVRYVTGVFDGLLSSPLMAKDSLPRAENLQRCELAAHITDIQIKAIVDKFLADNPERWGEDMGSLVFGAMLQACAKEGAPLD
jgi:hypothetical protein